MKQFILGVLVTLVLVSCTPIQSLDLEPYKNKSYYIREPVIQFKNLYDMKKWMKVNLSYALDRDVYGKDEYWASPQEFIDKKRGDCEDYAIFVAYFASKMGYDVRIVCYDMSNNKGHAIVKLNGVCYDAQNIVVVDEPKAASIWLDYSLDEALSVAYNKFGSRSIGGIYE